MLMCVVNSIYETMCMTQLHVARMASSGSSVHTPTSSCSSWRPWESPKELARRPLSPLKSSVSTRKKLFFGELDLGAVKARIESKHSKGLQSRILSLDDSIVPSSYEGTQWLEVTHTHVEVHGNAGPIHLLRVLVQLFECIIMGASESKQERPKIYNNDDDQAMSSHWDHLLSKEREVIERDWLSVQKERELATREEVVRMQEEDSRIKQEMVERGILEKWKKIKENEKDLEEKEKELEEQKNKLKE